MYGHDARHSGHVSGSSDIDSTTVSGLYRHATVTVDGPVIRSRRSSTGRSTSAPASRVGRAGRSTGSTSRPAPSSRRGLTGTAFYSWVSGIGGTPAVTGGRVYFTGVHGRVYCIDATTFTTLWSVFLKAADVGHNQPVTNPDAEGWSGPLVVGGRVYVGCGEGESAPTYGFVFCLNPNTGDVIWCFCTCRFAGAAENGPNKLPAAVAAPWAASHGFTVRANPPETGCSVWSSCAYDSVNSAIYVGTGNSQYPDTDQPDDLYGSGLISLDAVTGAFRGFFQPAPDDSYWPGDTDIDVPGSPTVYSVGARRVVAFGSKNGSVFILDAADVTDVVARRQILPRTGGTGLPGDRGGGIDAVVPNGHTGENLWGVFGRRRSTPPPDGCSSGWAATTGWRWTLVAPTRHAPRSCARCARTTCTTWPTAVGADNVIRYTATKPPMCTSAEVGLSSPAIVGDVVFVATSPQPYSSQSARLYALAVSDGHCLWSSPGLAQGKFSLGPAIYRTTWWSARRNEVTIFRLGPRWRFPIPWHPPIEKFKAIRARGRRSHGRCPGRPGPARPAAVSPGTSGVIAPGELELVAGALTFPTSVAFAADGTPLVAESGLGFGGARSGGRVLRARAARAQVLVEGLQRAGQRPHGPRRRSASSSAAAAITRIDARRTARTGPERPARARATTTRTWPPSGPTAGSTSARAR